MRLNLLALGLLMGAAWGCKPPPKEQTEGAFKKELKLHFNNLNNEAQVRKDELRQGIMMAQRNPALLPPTGTILNTFTFDPDAFVVENYRCKTPACGTKLLLPVPAAEYLCRSCGHSPYASHPGNHNYKESPCKICISGDNKPREPGADQVSKDAFKLQPDAVVKDMFELTESTPGRPFIAKVRYIRRQWVFDERATVMISDKAKERSPVEAFWIPADAGQEAYNRPGFHRLDTTFVGEFQIEFRGGELGMPKNRREEAVRPWKDLKGNK